MVSCLRHCNLSKIKGRNKAHVVLAYIGWRGTTSLILHLSTRWKWVVKFTTNTAIKLYKRSLCYKALTCGFSWGISHNDSPVNLFQKYGRFPLLLQNLRHPCWSNSGGNSGSIYIPGGIPCKTPVRVISFLKSYSAQKEYGWSSAIIKMFAVLSNLKPLYQPPQFKSTKAMNWLCTE